MNPELKYKYPVYGCVAQWWTLPNPSLWAFFSPSYQLWCHLLPVNLFVCGNQTTVVDTRWANKALKGISKLCLIFVSSPVIWEFEVEQKVFLMHA